MLLVAVSHEGVRGPQTGRAPSTTTPSIALRAGAGGQHNEATASDEGGERDLEPHGREEERAGQSGVARRVPSRMEGPRLDYPDPAQRACDGRFDLGARLIEGVCDRVLEAHRVRVVCGRVPRVCPIPCAGGLEEGGVQPGIDGVLGSQRCAAAAPTSLAARSTSPRTAATPARPSRPSVAKGRTTSSRHSASSSRKASWRRRCPRSAARRVRSSLGRASKRRDGPGHVRGGVLTQRSPSRRDRCPPTTPRRGAGDQADEPEHVSSLHQQRCRPVDPLSQLLNGRRHLCPSAERLRN
jgi:hypothetical protein